MIKRVAIAATFVLFSGCVSTKNVPIDESKIAKSPPTNIVVTRRAKPEFIARIRGRIASNEDRIIKENAVEDPARQIGEILSAALVEKYDLEQFPWPTSIKSNKPAEIAEEYAHADWVLDIETTFWGFSHLDNDWDAHRVLYLSNLRLIDTRDKSVLAKGFCGSESDDPSPSYDALLADNAKRLKSDLDEVARYCASEFKSNALNILE